MRILLDTGSQATLISASAVKRIDAENRIVPTRRVLSSFTQTQIRTIGEIDINLSIAGSSALHTCIVVPGEMECSILLGTDYMKPNNISIHMGESCVTSRHGKAEFVNSTRVISKRSKIRLTKTTVVPPNTVTFVSATLAGKQSHIKPDNVSGYIEPYINTMLKNEGVLIGSSLSNSSNGFLPVSCVNSTDKPVTLYKHTLLGFLCPFEMDGHLRGLRLQVNKLSCESTDLSLSQEWERDTLFDALRLHEIDVHKTDMKTLQNIVWENRDCFSKHEHDLGTCNFFKAQINLKPNHVPKWTPSRHIAYKLQGEMDRMINGMLKSGVIEECKSRSYWNSPVFLVSKPGNRGFRFVADFRGVNAECMPDGYELPNVNRVADTIGGCKLYSTFDLSKSFHQVEYEDSAKNITAFSVGNRRYVFRRMVMGHLSSSSQFTRMMDKLVKSIPDIRQLIYFLDDLCLASNTVEEHLTKLRLILEKFRESNLKLTPGKCNFLKPEVNFVGVKISEHGMKMTDDRIKAVANLKPPTTIKEVEKVMGFLAYNRKFVPSFAALAKPIYALIDRKRPSKGKLDWSKDCENNFNEIKRRICKGITLGIPDVSDPNESYQVKIDASLEGLGAELSQVINGERRTIAYFSKRVPPHKRTWGQTKLEFQVGGDRTLESIPARYYVYCRDRL